MKLLFALAFLAFIFATFNLYEDGTNRQQSETTSYSYEYNSSPVYSGVIRIYHDNVMCSGVVISRTLALSAAHCAVGDTRFMLTKDVAIYDSNDNDTKVRAKFIALNHDSDIALLKGDFKKFVAYPLTDTYSPKLGEHILSCGYPHDSVLVCQDVIFVGNSAFQWKVVGSPLQHGMSGGPAFNKDFQVIAVNSAVTADNSILSPTMGIKGMWGL